ncbi:hypothetical protein J1N35_042070 [Gossypium stocksii]|uniref:Protein kinase domain-containing protein n=1 Tax=Gossypium stocksii TaxID=47602 RepID=A0A9D3UGX2_9ROSI|nr:hypothetical protein J1N35_042070 [Gossypium stocksii]
MYVQSAPMAYKSTNASITVVADGSNPVGSCLPPPPVAATVVAPPPHASRDTNSVAALTTISVFVVLIVISLCVCCFCCRRLWRKRQKAIELDDDDDDELFGGDFQNGMGPRKFPFMEIAKMTSNFKGESLVEEEGLVQFTEGELVLVYEFMANGGLDSHLFKGKTLLTLVTIAYYIGISKLATSCWILISINAKLGDFGLARLVDHAKGSQTTHLAGTLGYMAPEYISSRKPSKESDVCSFGVVALEVAYGRRSIEPRYEESQASLVAWVRDLYKNRQLLGAADPRLCMDSNAMQVECLLMVGLWCVHPDRNLRPSIRQVIQVLNFEALLPELPRTRPNPIYDTSTASRIQASETFFSTVPITFPR